MSRNLQLLAFYLDQRRYALGLDAVERVVRMVEITPFPQAPTIVLGVVEVAGQLVPVLDLRRRFRLPAKGLTPDDFLVLARTSRRAVALPIDRVDQVLTVPDAALTPPQLVPDLEFLAGIVQVPGEDLVFVHDLDAFLSLEEEAALERAQAAGRP